MTDSYRIDLPLAMRDRLKDKARELSMPVTKIVEQAVEMVISGEIQPPILRSRDVTVQEAGDVLLGHIDAAQASLIRDLCREHDRHAYEYLLSYVYLAHERGETATMVGETVLDRETVARDEAAVGGTACEFCGAALVAPRRGQRFCPDPPADSGIESCGRKHSLVEMHARRAARTKTVDNRNAPTQQNVEPYIRAAKSAG